MFKFSLLLARLESPEILCREVPKLHLIGLRKIDFLFLGLRYWLSLAGFHLAASVPRPDPSLSLVYIMM